jgi:hypothetical protein
MAEKKKRKRRKRDYKIKIKGRQKEMTHKPAAEEKDKGTKREKN